MRPLLLTLIVLWAAFIQCTSHEPAEPKELVFATYTYSANDRLANLKPLAQWLTETTGMPVRAVSYPTVQALITAIMADSVDIAMMNTSGYLVLHKNHPGVAEPVVNLEMGNDSVTNYASCLISSHQSGIKSMSELKEAVTKYSFALVNKSSTSGNLVPRLLLNDAGIPKAEDKFNVYYAGTHKQVVTDVSEGKADLGGCGCTEVAGTGSGDMDDVKFVVVGIYDNTPLGPVVFSNKMEKATRDSIQAKLLAVHKKSPSVFNNFCQGWTEFKQATRFKPVSDSSYNTFRGMFGKNEDLWKMIE